MPPNPSLALELRLLAILILVALRLILLTYPPLAQAASFTASSTASPARTASPTPRTATAIDCSSPLARSAPHAGNCARAKQIWHATPGNEALAPVWVSDAEFEEVGEGRRWYSYIPGRGVVLDEPFDGDEEEARDGGSSDVQDCVNQGYARSVSMRCRRTTSLFDLADTDSTHSALVQRTLAHLNRTKDGRKNGYGGLDTQRLAGIEMRGQAYFRAMKCRAQGVFAVACMRRERMDGLLR